jgi:hypothetical protein
MGKHNKDSQTSNALQENGYKALELHCRHHFSAVFPEYFLLSRTTKFSTASATPSFSTVSNTQSSRTTF